MRMRYDSEADALYIRIAEQTVIDTKEIEPGVMLDYDSNGQIVGLEVLDASDHLAIDLQNAPRREAASV
jgi:uncharacterized protein YuzE